MSAVKAVTIVTKTAITVLDRMLVAVTAAIVSIEMDGHATVHRVNS